MSKDDDAGQLVTVADLEARWHPLTPVQQVQAKVLLEDALNLIKTECPSWENLEKATVVRVACQVVKRAMLSSEHVGLTQHSQTEGPFTDSYTFSNPDGDLYLTRGERKALGIAGQHAFFIDLSAGGASG